MTVDEMIECGFLMDLRDKGSLTSEQNARLLILQAQAKRELPTDETEIAKALRIDVEWQQRWGDLGRFLESLGEVAAKAVLAAFLQQVPGIIESALKSPK